RTIQMLAEAAVRRGYLGRAWLQRFLQAARYPTPDLLLAQLTDGPSPTVTLPGGTLVFLFTDIEGSTQLWEQDRAGMERALVQHDAVMRQAIEAYGGHVFKTVGDAFYAVFVTATDALDAALAAQRALGADERPKTKDENAPLVFGPSSSFLKVRMALHAGAAQQRDGDYFGLPLNRVARLCAAGYGGQVLLSASAWELARDHLPTGVTLRDLGEQRLKDLGRPERVFQVVTADLPSDFPPLRTLERYRHNLPAQATPLIGRETEILTVRDRLRQPATRLLTLTGPGGVGKTRVALQAAAELLDDAHDGVWFIPLAPIRDPQLVAPAIAKVLEMADSGDLPLVERLKRLLYPKQLLLVLDNFEQVSAAAPLVGELLAAAPDLKVLVTSRETLNVYGEQEFPIPPLGLPPTEDGRRRTGALPTTDYRLPTTDYALRITQYEAVRLFIERARAVKPDFAVTEDNAPAIAEICARLDGLPLAIELAAARSRIFTPEALLARLEGSHHRLAFLTGGARNLPARHQTLRSAIAWSYDLLEPAEQALFARLAVFSGGFTLDAAEAVCGDRPLAAIIGDRASQDGVLRELAEWSQHAPAYQVRLAEEDIPTLLESLVSKSLVKVTGDEGRRTEDGGRTEDEGRKPDAKPSPPSTVHRPPSVVEPRFTMLETIREYALERLVERGEIEAVRRRHAKFFLELAEKTEPKLCSPDQVEWLKRLESDYDNLRAALVWCRGETSDSEMALKLAGALWGFWFWRGDLTEGYGWLRDALTKTNRSHRTAARAKALCGAGALAWGLGDLLAARDWLEESVAICRDLGTQPLLAASLHYLGHVILETDRAAARVLFEESVSLCRATGDQWTLALT
ncbi:MAG: hypothetical protein KIT87_29570, partial [Anaerolineae bacterium]|nr:hypothetical protein [Anaerolineae bacterium]